MTDNLTAIGKADWIADFLLRVEASVMTMAKKLGEERDVAAIIEKNDKERNLFQFLSQPEISAYFNQDHIENWENPTKLFELLHHDGNIIRINGHQCVILQNPHPVFIRILQNMKEGSLGKNSLYCKPLPPQNPLYEQHSERISEALFLLKTHTPDYHFMVSSFLQKIILVDEYSSFRGATSYYGRGLAYFRPRETWDKLTWAEELVHEGTHNQVHTLLTFDPLVTGENRLTRNLPGPLRPDFRHHFGNFQALHVISRLINLNKTFAAFGLEPERLHQRNADLLARSKTPFMLLEKEAHLTEVGRLIFETETKLAFI